MRAAPCLLCELSFSNLIFVYGVEISLYIEYFSVDRSVYLNRQPHYRFCPVGGVCELLYCNPRMKVRPDVIPCTLFVSGVLVLIFQLNQRI